MDVVSHFLEVGVLESGPVRSPVLPSLSNLDSDAEDITVLLIAKELMFPFLPYGPYAISGIHLQITGRLSKLFIKVV